MEDLIVTYLKAIVGIFPHLFFLRMLFDLFRNMIFNVNDSAKG